jgi:hypothetical protein
MALGIPGIGEWSNIPTHVTVACSAHAGLTERQRSNCQPLALDWPGHVPRQARSATSPLLGHAG